VSEDRRIAMKTKTKLFMMGICAGGACLLALSFTKGSCQRLITRPAAGSVPQIVDGRKIGESMSSNTLAASGNKALAEYATGQVPPPAIILADAVASGARTNLQSREGQVALLIATLLRNDFVRREGGAFVAPGKSVEQVKAIIGFEGLGGRENRGGPSLPAGSRVVRLHTRLCWASIEILDLDGSLGSYPPRLDSDTNSFVHIFIQEADVDITPKPIAPSFLLKQRNSDTLTNQPR
jgi:hypothetical protein